VGFPRKNDFFGPSTHDFDPPRDPPGRGGSALGVPPPEGGVSPPLGGYAPPLGGGYPPPSGGGTPPWGGLPAQDPRNTTFPGFGPKTMRKPRCFGAMDQNPWLCGSQRPTSGGPPCGEESPTTSGLFIVQSGSYCIKAFVFSVGNGGGPMLRAYGSFDASPQPCTGCGRLKSPSYGIECQ